jgi:hypothetical protein
MKIIFCDGMVELNDQGQRINLGYLNLGAVPNYQKNWVQNNNILS